MNFISVPVAMFHHVNEHADDFITVSTENFRRQMRWLRDNGWTTLDADAFRDFKLGRRDVPKKSLLITFDDAWLDLYVNAWPVLRELDLRFTIFVISQFTEQASVTPPAVLPVQFPKAREAGALAAGDGADRVICGWPQLAEMLASGLCSVENHTATHNAKLIVSPDGLRRDIAEARDTIRRHLGVTANQLCWPKGRHTSAALAVARDLGIDTTYLVRRGVNLPDGDAMKIRRFTVEDRDEAWFGRQLKIFSSPLAGGLYAALKPDRLLEKMRGRSR